MNTLEKTYGNILSFSLAILNPLKKAIITTECKVHKYINTQALEILKNDKFIKEYAFFSKYILTLNEGAVWADQDFKSSSHFFNPYNNKGLFGRSHALDLALGYYNKAMDLWKIQEDHESMFYFGAALHILQDMTIPQHANIKLLDSHRQYETFVKKTYEYVKEFKATSGVFALDTFEEYMRFNAKVALKIHKKYKIIEEENHRFYKITKCALPLAQKSTASAMVLFFRHLFDKM